GAVGADAARLRRVEAAGGEPHAARAAGPDVAGDRARARRVSPPRAGLAALLAKPRALLRHRLAIDATDPRRARTRPARGKTRRQPRPDHVRARGNRRTAAVVRPRSARRGAHTPGRL